MRRTLAAAAFVLIADPALAHPPPLGIPGFTGGLLHPLFVPAHLMAIAALGMLIGWHYERWGRAAQAAYLAGAVAGLGAIAMAYSPARAGDAVVALAAVSGLLVALARPLPRALALSLAGATGLAVGLDSPPDTVSLDEANRMLAGTALGAAVALAVIAGIVARFPNYLQRIGLRVLGSWIAASAILMLAASLVR
jgi:hydrogenase/urease accessory protein HupE